MKHKGIIKIYKDKGVDPRKLPHLLNEFSNWKTTFISSKEIIQSSWEPDTSLLVIPGGRDLPFQHALKGEGNRRIRRFVENGGSFFGICAGAYYGCGAVEFDPGMDLEVVGMRELAFFPGIARGPAYGFGSFQYNSERGARASLISNSFNDETFRSYFNGGCYFVEADRYPNVETLSKYLDIEGHPAAIIKVSTGKGKVVLSGVHVELGTSLEPPIFSNKMSQILELYEVQRKLFFHKLLCKLGL